MPVITKETAKEMGRRGGLAKARNREASPEQRARSLLAAESATVAQELLDAALGRNAFGGLDSGTRIKALFRVADYTLGKPSVTAKSDDEPAPPGEAPGTGLSFGVADE